MDDDFVGAVTWFTFRQPEGIPHKSQLPEWMCRAGITDNGVIYAPGSITGNPDAVFLCAGFDGVQALMDEGAVYYPTTWLATEYPACREVLEKLEWTITAAKARI